MGKYTQFNLNCLRCRMYPGQIEIKIKSASKMPTEQSARSVSHNHNTALNRTQNLQYKTTHHMLLLQIYREETRTEIHTYKLQKRKVTKCHNKTITYNIISQNLKQKQSNSALYVLYSFVFWQHTPDDNQQWLKYVARKSKQISSNKLLLCSQK
jgi:hypothetical protein